MQKCVLDSKTGELAFFSSFESMRYDVWELWVRLGDGEVNEILDTFAIQGNILFSTLSAWFINGTMFIGPNVTAQNKSTIKFVLHELYWNYPWISMQLLFFHCHWAAKLRKISAIKIEAIEFEMIITCRRQVECMNEWILFWMRIE